ncbi:MAG: 30S ribosome-binding factor RbfA [Marinicaulis sp.]|nr:30S ribosome-binding factor RbfA [Marinicaulis sp.]NNE41675.1 30S ribosome-binding factor RbfA [Marinicaulis sp.]NNL89008.1 30S ribosome-binding factor RbfA [Marinicaulis sp.]
MPKRIGKKTGPSQRQLRAGELIRHALVEMLQRETFREPALNGVSVTISEVRCSPDLKNASCFAAPLGGEHQADVIDALNKIAPYLRRLLGQKIEMKFTPALVFKSDETYSEAQRINRLLTQPKVAQDLKKIGD